MYNVSDAYLEAIRKPVIKYSITGTIGGNNFNAYTIKEGSFQITNQCTDTNELMLGSCAIGQLKATFCDISIARNEWLDKVITPSCSVEVSEGQYESVPLGVFTIKQAEQTAEGVQITAYDNMLKFDKLFDATDKDFDKTGKPYYFLNKICQKCGVTLGMTQNEVNALPNGDNTMYICGVRKGTTDYANDIETYRDALFYLAQACACFATINRLGRLELRPFRQSVTDYISDTDRLAGAEFADYVTSFTGIYVDSLYDGRTTFYGYDLEKLQENLVEYTARKEEEEDAVDEDEADIDEIQEKYNQGQITEEQYAEQMAAAIKKLKEDQAKLKATNKYLNWLNKAIAKAQANAQGTIMDLEGNPFLQHKDSSIRSIAKVTTATELRTTIMRRLSKMEYVPFSCSSVFGVHYDLGDRIMFTDGHADDDLGCITAFDWTYNGEYSMYGYGANPDEATVRPKIEKAMKQANENALNRADIEMVEVDDNVPEGSPKPVVVRKRSAASSTGENWVSKVIYIWSYYKYSAGRVPQCGITRVKVSCTTGFALCTYDPGRDVYPGENENIINGIKRHDLMITFVALQIPMNELDSYELPKIKFECTRVYAPDPEHALDVTPQMFNVPEGQDTMELIGGKTVQDPDDVYLYWRLPITSIQYGYIAHGIATEYSQDSVNFHFNSMNAWSAAGIIFLDTIPDLKPGDVMLPTASGQKQTAASVENIARKIAGAGSDESQYVDASFLDEGYVNGAVDVESKTLHEAIGKSIDKVFDNLDPNIREIYYNTVDPGSIDYYIKDFFHGGDANRLFEYKTYDGEEHHLTIGNGIPTLFANEYLLDEIINDSHYNLEGSQARGKVYIRIGDKSGIRLAGEVGEDCSAADKPKFTMGGWGDAMRFLDGDGYALWVYRDSEDDMMQYIEYSLANTEGGKTYSMSFDFHASIIAGECDIDTTRPLGILISTSSSLDSSILDDLPLDEDVWHDSDPDNMYLSFYHNFQIVTTSPEGEMTFEYQNYSFTFTAQAGKDYYIYFITSAFVSEDASRLRMRVKDFVSSEGIGVAEIKVSYQGGPSYATDEWYTVESGGGGTSDLDAIEITYADYQSLTPEEKADPDKIYFITDYPSVFIQSDWAEDDSTSPAFIMNKPSAMPASDVAAWAKAPTKPDYEFSEIENTPTTLAGYGITDAVQKEAGKGLSTNDYTTAEKNKLAGIESGAQVNTVTSVAGKTGAVTLASSDVGLGNVPNVTTDNQTPTVTEASARVNLASGDTLKTIIGKIKKFFADLKTVAFTGAYSDLTGTPTIPSVGNGTITIQKNGTNVNTFTTNQSSNKTINITMNKSDVGLGNVNNTSDANKPISTATQAALDGKADASDIASVKTVTGNPISISDGSETYADELVIDLEPIQDLHGYDKPWVGGVGKNKLKIVDHSFEGTNYTLTFNSDGSIILNGTISNTLTWPLTSTNGDPNKLYLPAGTYKIVCESFGNSNCYIGVNVNSTSGNYSATSKGTRTFTITDGDYAYVRLRIGVESFTNEVIHPMILLESETDTSFAPYENISPITGYTEVNVTTADASSNPTVERTVTTHLGQTVYGATVDVANGVMVINKMFYEFDGTELWDAINSGNTQLYRLVVNNLETFSYSVEGESSHFDNAAIISATTDIGYMAYTSTSDPNKVYVQFRPDLSVYDTVGKWKAYLAAQKTANTPVQCWFEVLPESYITVPLTPQQLKLLKGQNYITSNGTTIHLTYQPDNAVGDAVAEAEKYTDRAIEGKQDRDVGNYSRNLFNKDNPITIEGYISGSTGVLTTGSANEHCLVIKLDKGDYTFSRTIPSSDTTTKRFRVAYFNSIPSVGDQGIILLNADSALTGTFTMPADGYAVIFMFNGASAWIARQEAFDSLQIEHGTTVHAYESYIPTNAELATTKQNLPVTILDDVAVSSSSTQYTIPDISQYTMVQFVLTTCPASRVAYVRDTKTIPVSVLLYNIATYTYNHIITLLAIEPSITDKWTECRIEMNSTTQITVYANDGTSYDGAPRLSIIAW